MIAISPHSDVQTANMVVADASSANGPVFHEPSTGMNAPDPIRFTPEPLRLSTLMPKRRALSLYVTDYHFRACKMVVHAMTADDPTIWTKTAAVLAHRLTTRELAFLAFAALRALEPEVREAVCDAATLDHGPCEPEPSGWNLEAIAEYREARDRGAARA